LTSRDRERGCDAARVGALREGGCESARACAGFCPFAETYQRFDRQRLALLVEGAVRVDGLVLGGERERAQRSGGERGARGA
jgi:hypothetical protein